MKPLPKVLALMHETNLPIASASFDDEDRVVIEWEREPMEHEKELAQRCTHFQKVLHKYETN